MPEPIPPTPTQPPDVVDPKMTESRQVEPVRVTVIGTGDGSRLEKGTVAVTDGEHQPNVVINDVISPALAIGIRAGNLFLQTLVGLLVAAMTPAGADLLYTSDFVHLLGTCASLSVPVTILGSLKDLITVFGRLEQKFPLLTGKV